MHVIGIRGMLRKCFLTVMDYLGCAMTLLVCSMPQSMCHFMSEKAHVQYEFHFTDMHDYAAKFCNFISNLMCFLTYVTVKQLKENCTHSFQRAAK